MDTGTSLTVGVLQVGTFASSRPRKERSKLLLETPYRVATALALMPYPSRFRQASATPNRAKAIPEPSRGAGGPQCLMGGGSIESSAFRPAVEASSDGSSRQGIPCLPRPACLVDPTLVYSLKRLWRGRESTLVPCSLE